MKFVYASALTLLAALAVASPAAELEKRARCSDAYYSLFLSNSASASSFCISFVTVAPVIIKTTVSTGTTVTSTVKTVTAAGLNPTQTFTTTAASTTYTTTITAAPTPVKKRSAAAEPEAHDLEKRDFGLPGFIAPYESSQAASACSCFLTAVTVTSTISKVSTSVVKVTATSYTGQPVISTVTTTTGATTLTSTLTPSACPTSGSAIKNGDFEQGAVSWTPDPALSQGSFSIASTSGGWPCIGEYCGLLGANSNKFAGGNNLDSSFCVGATYTISASFRAVGSQPDPNIVCYGYVNIIKKSDYTLVKNPTQSMIPYDNQYHTITGTWTATQSDVYLNVQGYCQFADASVTWQIAVDNVVASIQYTA